MAHGRLRTADNGPRTADGGLWTTDGTESGTTKIGPYVVNSAFTTLEFKGKVYLAAASGLVQVWGDSPSNSTSSPPLATRPQPAAKARPPPLATPATPSPRTSPARGRQQSSPMSSVYAVGSPPRSQSKPRPGATLPSNRELSEVPPACHTRAYGVASVPSNGLRRRVRVKVFDGPGLGIPSKRWLQGRSLKALKLTLVDIFAPASVRERRLTSSSSDSPTKIPVR